MSEWLDMILEDRVDPDTFHEHFPWAEDMIDCPHDSVYHAEGDPWVHTKMVVNELVTSQDYLDLPEERQQVLRLAAWFHDVAKPATTVVSWLSYINPYKDPQEVYRPTSWHKDVSKPPVEGWHEVLGRVKVGQPGHAPLGASMSYQALIDEGADVQIAREVHALVFWHQRPFFLMNEKSAMRRAIQFSHDIGRGSWHELLTLCRADNRGRTSINAQETLDGLDMLELELDEMGVNINCDLVHEPWPFDTEEARMKYLRGKNVENAFYMPENNHKGRMILMSGLPGSGKDTLAAKNFPSMPVVSLDDIRGQMDIGWKDNQGQVLQAGFEAARVQMRKGNDFIWNATGITRQVRQKIIGLARDYDYRVDGVSIDIPLSVAKARNKERERAVPDAVMDKLGRKREPIISDEVHTLWSVDENSNFTTIMGPKLVDLTSELEL